MPSTSFETAIGLCGISWEGGLITRFLLPPASPASDPAPLWVVAIITRAKEHLSGSMQDFADLPYDWAGVSEFQRRVYETSLQAKAGQTWSYGQLAAAMKDKTAIARAVGVALGQNPWPLLVPCHRFIGADGRMTGFSSPGGIKTKLRLLTIEGAELFAE